MSETEFHPGTCSCGAEFELQQSGTESSVLGRSDGKEYRLYSCPDCGKGKRYVREGGDWERGTY